MVVIRLSRGGTNKRPFYYVVVADSRCARNGRYIEEIGYFNPIATGGEIKLKLNNERVDYWVKAGAQLSDRVGKLLLESARPEILEKRKAKKAKRHAVKKKTKLEAATKAAAEKAVAESPEKAGA